MKLSICWRVVPFLLASIAFGHCADINAATNLSRLFPHPDRICYDSQCLTIDGKELFIFSGSFHYFRCPKELWRDRFQKIKDAGFNTVETYVPWNWCEQQAPRNLKDFSNVNLTDLDDWLKMAEEFGLYVIVRPGPYICAEWDTGGFPQWLLTKKPAGWKNEWLRSDEPNYLDWCKHWYDAVCPVIAKHQITRKPPGQPGVILVQLENEYDYSDVPAGMKRNQLKALAGYAHADGIDVPLITCWTHEVRGSTDPVLRRVFDACNFYPNWDVDSIQKDIEKLRREQPDAPLATTELQGGWFAQVGGKLSEDQDGITASQINNLTLFAIQNGETILNYYILFGGTNPGNWAARDITTTYDYNAPIREWGGVGDRYQRVWALGHMLQEHGAKLARAVAVDCDVSVPQKDVTVVMRRAPDGSRYLFVRTSQHDEPREGTAHVKEKAGGTPEIVFDYKLEPFGSMVLYLPPGVNDAAQGEWLPKAAPAIERPADLPLPVTITSARTKNDPGPSHWTGIKPGQSLGQAGISDNSFEFYRANVSNLTATNLLVEYPANDDVLAMANGTSLRRVGGLSSGSIFALPPVSGDVLLLYENHGHANSGRAMEDPTGLFSAQLAPRTSCDERPITGWRMFDKDGVYNRPEVKPDFKDDDWTPVAIDKLEPTNLPAGHTAIYRASVELTEADLQRGKIDLNLGRVHNYGWVYVNGGKIGETADGTRSYSFDVTGALHPGRNVIAVIVYNDSGDGGLGMSSLIQSPEGIPVPLGSLGPPDGIEKQWWKPDFDDKRWETVRLGEITNANAPQTNALLTWYRMNFKLQPPKPGIWVPWHLRLNATGNGCLYLNGHSIGRYWQAGPQHDFFLPECWLNFGPAQDNVIVLSLRPLGKGAGIQSAAVEPYAGYAEKR